MVIFFSSVFPVRPFSLLVTNRASVFYFRRNVLALLIDVTSIKTALSYEFLSSNPKKYE
jgi:hypothetical protein